MEGSILPKLPFSESIFTIISTKCFSYPACLILRSSLVIFLQTWRSDSIKVSQRSGPNVRLYSTTRRRLNYGILKIIHIEIQYIWTEIPDFYGIGFSGSQSIFLVAYPCDLNVFTKYESHEGTPLPSIEVVLSIFTVHRFYGISFNRQS